MNDNLRNTAIQGHPGMMVECTSCHVSMPVTISGGPHGMHPIGQDWVNNHHDLVEFPTSTGQCQACHGVDYMGTVLSRAQAARSWNAFGGTITFPRGAQIGCYNCHQGPGEGNPNPSIAPVASDATNTTANNNSVAITLPVTGTGLTLRIISQPANGTVGLVNHVATYFPNPGFVGSDTFTFAAYDGQKNSNLGSVTIAVGQGPFSITASAQVPPSYPAGWPVAFATVPTVTNNNTPPTFNWNFGDGTSPGTSQFPTHTYTLPGSYNWTVVASVAGSSSTVNGTIVIGNPVSLGISYSATGNSVTLSWPLTIADTLLQTSSDLGLTSPWVWVPNLPAASGGMLNVTLPVSGNQFFRVSRPW